MSKFFKNMAKKPYDKYSNDITNYLINEIEDIVSKKVDNNYQSSNTESIYSRAGKKIAEQTNAKFNEKPNFYEGNINYSLLDKGSTPKISSYVESENEEDFLPFNKQQIGKEIRTTEQIKSIIKQTLRPAFNEWLDEHLDEIIDKAMYKREQNNSNYRVGYGKRNNEYE